MIDSQAATVPSTASQRCRALARAGAIVAGVVSVSVLVGWSLISVPAVLHLYQLTDKPSPQAAVGLLLCSVSLWLQARDRLSRPLWITGLAAAAITVALGVAAQAEWLLDRELGLPNLFTTAEARETLAALNIRFDGRMSHGGSALLIMLGVAALLHRAPPGPGLIVTSVFTPLALFLSLIGLLGFAFAIPSDSAFWKAIGIAMQTALAGLILAPSLILARPDRPLMAMIISPMAGGYLARRILLAGLAVPLVVAVVEFLHVPSSWLGEQAAAAVLVVASMGVLGIVILVTCSALNRADEHRRRAEASRALMLDELDHRVKNTLATVQAVCEHTMAGARDMRGFEDAFRGRIRAMALAHEALAARRWEGVYLRRMVETVVAPFIGPGAASVRIHGQDVLLSARAALPVVATLHELATNAGKHGTLAGPGRGLGVDVAWTIDDTGTVVLDWIEPASGIGPRGNPGESGGFGTNLIRGLIAHELKGSTDLTIGPGGVRCRMIIPGSGRRPDGGPRP